MRRDFAKDGERRRRWRIAYKSFDFCVTQDKNMKPWKATRKMLVVGRKKPEIPSTQRGMKSNVVLFMDAISSLCCVSFFWNDIDDSEQSFEDHEEKKEEIKLLNLQNKNSSNRRDLWICYFNLDFIWKSMITSLKINRNENKNSWRWCVSCCLKEKFK